MGPSPADVRGFRARLDLHATKPPVWRRLELPGDLTLSQLHRVIQAAMGWTDSHLHRFRTGSDDRSAHFVTSFDVEEGEDGVLEADVRLDQLVAGKGDRIWYEYDFGDGWDHVLTIEGLLDEPPTQVRCTGGRGACPPEDCGGVGGYEELAASVRSGYDERLLPRAFDSAAHAHVWLPIDWQPDELDLAQVNEALVVAVAEPVAVTEDLAGLLEQVERRGIRALREVLTSPLSHGPIEVTDADVVRLTRTYREFLEVVGDGVTLTSAGYLPPVDVESFAERSGITMWWIGKANREDLKPPVQSVPHLSRTRVGHRPKGAIDAHLGRQPRPPRPPGTLAAYRRSAPAGHEVLRARGRLAHAGGGRQRCTDRGLGRRRR